MKYKILAALPHSTAVSSVEFKGCKQGDMYFKSHKHKECLTHMFSIVFFILPHAQQCTWLNILSVFKHTKDLCISSKGGKVYTFLLAPFLCWINLISYTQIKLLLVFDIALPLLVSCISIPVKPPVGTCYHFFAFSIKYLVINASSKTMAMI